MVFICFTVVLFWAVMRHSGWKQWSTHNKIFIPSLWLTCQMIRMKVNMVSATSEGYIVFDDNIPGYEPLGTARVQGIIYFNHGWSTSKGLLWVFDDDIYSVISFMSLCSPITKAKGKNNGKLFRWSPRLGMSVTKTPYTKHAWNVLRDGTGYV